MSDEAFAILVPASPLSRLAFSDLYSSLAAGRQNSRAGGSNAHACRDRMTVEPEQIFDRDVLRLRFEMERRSLRGLSGEEGETSESLTEPDTDTEDAHHDLGMIWKGHYFLTFRDEPLDRDRGWTLGKGPLMNAPTDFLLCTRSFAKFHDINLKNPHARINFAVDNRSLYITGSSRSPTLQLKVNGDTASQRPYHLNQYRMKIQFDKLDYEFRWTPYAARPDFLDDRQTFMATAVGGPASINFDMPTPLENTRTMGRWTLGEALGKGGIGRVFFGSDTSGSYAAVKVMERNARNKSLVDDEVKTLQRVTDFVNASGNGERIVRVSEVVYSNEQQLSSRVTFDNVVVVLQPLTPRTLFALYGAKSRGDARGMTTEAASVFRDALLGVKAMHDGGWAHRDLKASNIGIIGDPALRSVLLDTGTSLHIPAGQTALPMPGTTGTVGYLAPEMELDEYDHSVDIWAMGITLYELTYGVHPWMFSINPWRSGSAHEQLRQTFQLRYQTAIEKMSNDYAAAQKSPAAGYIHLGGLFVEMVRHSRAQHNNGRRPTIADVLQHPAWGSFLPDNSGPKKQRLQ